MKSFALGIAGYSGGGKTTLIEKLIPVLKSRGIMKAWTPIASVLRVRTG